MYGLVVSVLIAGSCVYSFARTSRVLTLLLDSATDGLLAIRRVYTSRRRFGVRVHWVGRGICDRICR